MMVSTSGVLVITMMKPIIFVVRNSTTTVKPIAILRLQDQKLNSPNKAQTSIITTQPVLKPYFHVSFWLVMVGLA